MLHACYGNILHNEARDRAVTCFSAGVGRLGRFQLPLLVVETPEASNCNVTKPLYEAAVAHPAPHDGTL